MKQVNPKYKLKLGASLNELDVDLDDFNDGQITQLYELFQESTKQKRNQPSDNESK